MSNGFDSVVTDRGDIDRDYPWVPNERIKPTSNLFIKSFSSASAARWCAACVHTSEYGMDAEDDGLTLSDLDGSTGLTVSIMNKRLLAMTNTKAMSIADWVALAMCAYIVGLNIAGEVKDMMLCEMSIDSKKDDLSQGWLLALTALGRLRSQILLAPLMGAIPAVVLTQGGHSLAICFNTIAILFITEVDNVSYQFGLSERAKESVDAHGHVLLTDEQARSLSQTKVMCTVVTMALTLLLVWNGASVAAMIYGGVMALGFKLSELLSKYKTMTKQEIATFVGVSVATFLLSFGLLLMVIMGLYSHEA